MSCDQSSGPDVFPSEDQPNLGGESILAVLSPSIISVFGLKSVIDATSIRDSLRSEGYNRINMPALEVQEGLRNGPVIPLHADAQEKIRARSQRLVEFPGTRSDSFEYGELVRFQQWLDYMAIGMSEANIGRQLKLGRRTIGRISENMREFLGAANQASIMYSALLHGYVTNVDVPDTIWPELTVNRRLHFFLASLGFEAQEAADLTMQQPGEVKSLKLQAMRKLGATAMTQAIAHAFKVGYYSPLPS